MGTELKWLKAHWYDRVEGTCVGDLFIEEMNKIGSNPEGLIAELQRRQQDARAKLKKSNERAI